MIAIPNMSKPKSCGECEFNYCLEGGSYEWWECVILHDDINQFDTRRTDCPLIEIDLVRCGECKHYGFKETDRGGFPCCTNEIGVTPYRMPTDFCNYGERRADGDI